MNKLLKGQCSQCGSRFEFAAQAVGTIADCPHCGQPTEMLLAELPRESAVPRKTLIYTGLAIAILIGGLVAAIVALKRAERLVGRNPPLSAAPAPSPSQSK